ncbi:hypothetical protein Gohar_006944 [Gossypium harknessii]|uniref:Uncharacterized protein n=1 Tax=Gossypium harknessii TaxID=34285 RepID=A0A7J9GF22_9ROSI|nr:hypothetical protein [Gossypium harknessii]
MPCLSNPDLYNSKLLEIQFCKGFNNKKDC